MFQIHSDFFTQFKKSNNSNNTDAASNNKVSVENFMEKDNKKIDVKSPVKDIQKHSSNEHETKNKTNKKKKNENRSKKTQKVKRKRIQTFDSSDEEIDSEEEGL